MLSRVAENLYWMSRYVERAEGVARLLDAAFYLELDAAALARDDDGTGPVEGVLTILGCRPAFEAHHDSPERDAVLRFLTFDRKNPQSILSMIARARENARGTQEAISAEVWSEINRTYLYLCGQKAQRRFAASPFEFYGGIKRSCVLWAGLVDGTLARDEVYHFLHAGRYLERADQVGRILRAKSHTLHEPDPAAIMPMRPIHWSSLLRSCSAYDAYLRTYRERVDPQGVVRYLVLDADFPRAPAVLRGEVSRGPARDFRRGRRRIWVGGRTAARPAGRRASLHRRERDLRSRVVPVPQQRAGDVPPRGRGVPQGVFRHVIRDEVPDVAPRPS